MGYDLGMRKQIAIVEDEPALRENYAAARARRRIGSRTSARRTWTMR